MIFRITLVPITYLKYAVRQALQSLCKKDVLIWVPAWVIGLIGLTIGFGRAYPDSHTYIAWAKFYAGEDSTLINPQSHDVRLIAASSRPIVPLLASLLFRVGVDIMWSYGLVNTVFSFAGTVISYRIGKLLMSRGFGLECAAFYFTSTSILAYGASVLTDTAGYFFIGLALYMGLSRFGASIKKAFAEGSIMAISLLTNPVGFVALLYASAHRCLLRSRVASFAAGVSLVLIPALTLGLATGLLELFIDFWTTNKIFDVIGKWTGGPPLDALVWTFNVSVVNIPFHGLVVQQNIANLFFLFVLLLGFAYLPRKKELLFSVPFLLVYVYLAHDLIERYLFNLWPLLLPVTIVGLRRIFLVVGTIASKLARRFGIGTEPLLLDALVAFFLNAQSAVNLHSISPVFFGTWSHVGVYIVVVGCFLIAYQILEIHGKVRNHM